LYCGALAALRADGAIGPAEVNVTWNLHAAIQNLRYVLLPTFPEFPKMSAPLEHYEYSNRRFTVSRGRRGWEVTEERDREVVRHVTYSDWHRVELASRVFRLQMPGPDHSTNL
jgi:hypothetical protein